MTENFVISDTHFSHKRSLTFMRKDDPSVRLRDFASMEEMDETMVSNWNNVVGDNDIVYHLGDFSFGGKQNIAKFASRLKGRKRLIMGNHDYNARDYIDHFEKVMSWYELETNGITFVLTHAPLYRGSFDYRFDGQSINVHGHLHDRLTKEPYHVNVCVENINYTPVNIRTIGINKHG